MEVNVMRKTIREWLTENRSKYNDRIAWITDCSKKLDVRRESVCNTAASIWASDRSCTKNCSSVIARKSGMTRSQFMAKYDYNTRIREAIRKGIVSLTEQDKPENDVILEESEFRLHRCENIPVNGFKQIARESEFLKYQFKIGEKVFWTTTRQRKWALENIMRAREV